MARLVEDLMAVHRPRPLDCIRPRQGDDHDGNRGSVQGKDQSREYSGPAWGLLVGVRAPGGIRRGVQRRRPRLDGALAERAVVER